MEIIFGIIVLSAFLFMIFKKLNNRYQEQVFRHKMFTLRDELRMLAIDKAVNPACKGFDYLDYSISKSIEQSYFFTLFYIISLEIKHDADVEKGKLEAYKEKFEEIVKDIEAYDELKSILVRKDKIIRQYVLGQTPIFLFIFKQSYTVLSKFFNIKKLIVKRLSEINYLPELSGLKLYN